MGDQSADGADALLELRLTRLRVEQGATRSSQSVRRRGFTHSTAEIDSAQFVRSRNWFGLVMMLLAAALAGSTLFILRDNSLELYLLVGVMLVAGGGVATMRYDAILICTRNEKVRIVCRDIAEDVGEFHRTAEAENAAVGSRVEESGRTSPDFSRSFPCRFPCLR